MTSGKAHSENRAPSIPDRESLARELNDFRAQTGIPGLAVDIGANGGRLGLAIGAPTLGQSRRLSANSRFRISCAVKFFVAQICLQLAAEGRLSLQAFVGEYIPELGTAPGSKGHSITIQHLLTHTSGYRGLDIRDSSLREDWSWQDCATYFQSTPQLYEPGTVFNEEHLDHVILGQILRLLTGKTVGALLEERILAPIGVTVGDAALDSSDPAVRVDGHAFSTETRRLEVVGGKRPRSEIWSPALSDITMTVRDLGTVAAVFADGAGAVVPPALAETAFSTDIALPRIIGARLNPNWAPVAFGPVCARFANGLFGYFGTGRGQNGALVFDRQHKISMAVALNVEAAPLRAAVLDILKARLFGAEPPDFRRALGMSPIDCDFDEFVSPFRPEELEGEYAGNARDTIRVVYRERKLTFHLGPRLTIEVASDQDNHAVADMRAPVPISVFADPTGAPSLMIGLNAYKRINPSSY